jgi:hypothetical protein
MAEIEGFEPPRILLPNSFRNCPLQPLGYISLYWIGFSYNLFFTFCLYTILPVYMIEIIKEKVKTVSALSPIVEVLANQETEQVKTTW